MNDADREATLTSLTLRLKDGEARIQSALAHGEDVSAWEEFWLRLLHEYETLHDRLSDVGSEEREHIAA